MKKNKYIIGILITAATIIGSPSFWQNTEKIITNTKKEISETIPEDIWDYPIQWIEKHFGKEKTAEIIRETILKKINKIREQNWVAELIISKELSLIAQNYSEEMAINKRYNHIGKNGSTPVTRAQKAGYKVNKTEENISNKDVDSNELSFSHMLENIGYNYYSINDAINHRSDPINHPNHFANMINSHAKYLWVWEFGGYWDTMFSR